MGKEYHVDCAQGSAVIEKGDSVAMSCLLGEKKEEEGETQRECFFTLHTSHCSSHCCNMYSS